MSIQTIKNELKRKIIRQLGGFTKQEVLQIAPPEIREPHNIQTLMSIMEIDTLEFSYQNSRIERMKKEVLFNLMRNEISKFVEWEIVENKQRRLTTLMASIKIVEGK